MCTLATDICRTAAVMVREKHPFKKSSESPNGSWTAEHGDIYQLSDKIAGA